MDGESSRGSAPARSIVQRRRTAFACVSCRFRKSRCDGQTPCSTCQALDIDCNYDHETISTKGKSDLILSAISRLEKSIADVDSNVTALRQDVAIRSHTSHAQFSPVAQTPHNEVRSNDQYAQSFSRGSPSTTNNDPFSNATIAEHTSTTEAILHWPIFDQYSALRTHDVIKSGAIFWMENTRGRRITGSSLPFLSREELNRITEVYLNTTNFCYPIVALEDLNNLKLRYLSNHIDQSVESCLICLIIALGCAAETVHGLAEGHDAHELIRSRHLGRAHFDTALTGIHMAYCTFNVQATRCLALTALYYAYLQRPLQAWSMLSLTATSCRVMMSYSVPTPVESECVRRIFWMCFILESDYLAELPSLPRFGIADIESNVPLPGEFACQENSAENELSSVYFLACISMRRFLNRCHHLLFGQKSISKLGSRRLAEIVSELYQQLEDWKRLLPAVIQFDVNTEPVNSQHGAFLRQRYLTCLALIHRPYVIQAMSDFAAGRASEPNIINGAWQCLQACIMHIINLRPFDQTIMVDVWICSLSMAGTMMILLAASNITSLSEFLGGSKALVGPHLLSLFNDWCDVHGEGSSPSVRQAVEWIEIVNHILPTQ